MSVVSQSTPLNLRRELYDQLREHGVETYPHECCGILLGRSFEKGITVEDLMRAGNTRTDSAHNRYHIDPRELIAAQREGRKLGLDIVGFYHSHPDHPAQWSQTDFAEAHWFGCSYLITAVEGDKQSGKATISNSFLLTGSGEEDKAFQPQSITIE
ncbi:MAG: Mov34/MPN/PAD-1 family protein [Janthinobacterium lividum]